MEEKSEERRDSYSVWAIPPDDVSHRIKKLMDGLRSEFGGPEIEPHIPIVGSIHMTREEALNQFRSSEINAYVAQVEAVLTWPSYYHCLCLMFHLSQEVEEETGGCSKDFGIWNTTLPQLSLTYGNLTEEERKHSQEKVRILDESITSLSFPVTRIALYKIDYKDKTLKSWERIAERSLHFNQF